MEPETKNRRWSGRLRASGSRLQEDGNVLLLSLFVLATILLGAVTLSSIVLRDLAVGRVIDDGHLAYYAAESSAEEALYALRKADVKPELLGGDGVLENGATYTRTVAVGEPVFSIPLLREEDFLELPLFDPDNMAASPGVEAFVFTWEDACSGMSSLEFSYTEWPAGAMISWPPGGAYSGTFWKFRQQLSDLAGSAWIKADTISAANNYRLRLRAENCSISNLEIRAFADDAATLPTDIPARVFLTNRGVSGKANQVLSVAVPRLAPLTGIFTFVLFSEELIEK